MLRSGQAKPKGRAAAKRNVGKGRKEWRHFAEADEKEKVMESHTNNEVDEESQ